MWSLNSRNWWKQQGRLRKQQWKKANKTASEVFFGWVVVPNVKLQRLSSATSFWSVFYISVKTATRKKIGNYQWFWYDHANYQGSPTTPGPFLLYLSPFFTCLSVLLLPFLYFVFSYFTCHVSLVFFSFFKSVYRKSLNQTSFDYRC